MTLSMADFRQMRFPKAFRIDAPAWPPELVESLAGYARAAADAARESQRREPDKSESMTFLAEVGTGLWRLKLRMLQPGTDRPLDEMRKAYRHLESTWDALSAAGLRIIDHTGMPFDAGLSIKVLAYQPTAGLARQRVLDTVKPTIYLRETRLQIGEVIVGTPDPSDSTESDRHASHDH